MLGERQEITQKLQDLITVLSDGEIPISEADRTDKIKQLEQCKRIVLNKKYHVTTLGIFSTGKSTLINSMIGGNYLPAADHPTTARITEIRPSTDAFVILQADKSPREKELDIARKFLTKIGYDASKKGKVLLQSKMIFDSATADSDIVNGIVISGTNSRPLKAEDIHQILACLVTEEAKQDDATEKLINQLKMYFKDIIIGLPVAEWMSDIVLTDAPGTGSVVDAHDTIINKIIPESQLVLHIVDAERIGDSTDKLFAERIANFQHRKIFYIMNKIDRMTDNGCDDAEDELKKTLPSETTKGCTPEIIRVSALSAFLAIQLKAGLVSIKDIMENRKLSMGYLYGQEKFCDGTEEQKKRILYEELWGKSHFTDFEDRVATYLRKENKQMAIIEDAINLVRGFASDVKSALDEAIRLLSSDTKIGELEKEKYDNAEKRKKLKEAADRSLAEYKIRIEGGMSTVTCKSYNGVAEEIKTSLEQSKRDIEVDLSDWLVSNYDSISNNPKKVEQYIQSRIENSVTKARNVAESQVIAAIADLKTEIVDILREARDLSLMPAGSGRRTLIPDLDTSIDLQRIEFGSGLALIGAGLAAALGSVIPGVGTTLGAGIGAGVGAIVGVITSIFCPDWKKKKRDKIIAQVNSNVQKLFFDGGRIGEGEKIIEIKKPYYALIRDDLSDQCNKFRNDLQKKLEHRFNELNERDNVLVNEIARTKTRREEKISKYIKIEKKCSCILNSSNIRSC
ncbi:MAG: dynamin family protein [Oligosphaeraceae bacterium]